SCGRQTEGYIRDAQYDIRVRHLGAYISDRLYSLVGIFTVFFDTRRDRQGERIKENVMPRYAKFSGLSKCTTRDSDLVLRRARHSRLVDQTDDNSGAKFSCKPQHLQKTRLAVLVICRVENRFP